MDQAQLIKVLTKVCIFMMFATVGAILYGLAKVNPVLIPLTTVGAFFCRSGLLKLVIFLIDQFSYICGLMFNTYR